MPPGQNSGPWAQLPEFQAGSECGEGIILKIHGSEGNDSTVSSEVYKACSDNPSHQRSVNGVSTDCHLPKSQKQISQCIL